MCTNISRWLINAGAGALPPEILIYKENVMKRVYVNEEWCLGCHLCEYNCAFANSGESDMVKALKGKPIRPRIRVEGDERITYAVSCRTNELIYKTETNS